MSNQENEEANRRISLLRVIHTVWNEKPDVILCQLVERRPTQSDLDWIMMEARSEGKPHLEEAAQRAYDVIAPIRQLDGILDGV